MVTHHSAHKWLFYLLILMFMTACSGSGTTTGLSGAGTLTQGIAVDPYIEGAVFQEVESGTATVLQRQSSSSDEFGRFTFPNPLTPGSVVELKISHKGLHGGAPYQGMLRRMVTGDDGQPLVISPLTTLMANGVAPEELIAAFDDAGLAGLTIPDLYTDPMAGLAHLTTGVSDQDLKILQASMAANAYMEVTGNFYAGTDELNDYGNFEIFKSMVESMENLLNADEFGSITAALANDPDMTGPPILEDFILAVLAQQRTIVALAQEDMQSYGDFSPALVAQAVESARGNGTANVKSYYNLRVPPSASHDGEVLYQNNCSGCHNGLATTDKAGRSMDDIQSAIAYNLGGMGFLSSLTQGEIAAIAEALQPASPAVPDTSGPADGTALYASKCAGCHQPLDETEKAGRTAAAIQAAIANNLGNMGFLSSLTQQEVQAIADVLPQAPVVNPQLPPDGAALYASECAGCHQPLDVSEKAGRTAAAIQTAINNNLGNMGFLSSLTQQEVQAIADVLPQGDNTGSDYSDCTLCHGQPPAGNSYPDTAGAHAAHAALASVGTSCSTCHLGAAHNSQVDLGFPAGFNAKSGPATDNLDGTCSSVKCHGGKKTPDWWEGSIVVDTQCTLCHAAGTSQYNSYSSGMHKKHVQDKGYSCTVCHNTATLRNGHFTNMESSAFELSPAATIGGGSTRVGKYSNGTCSSIDCHGSESWSGEGDERD